MADLQLESIGGDDARHAVLFLHGVNGNCRTTWTNPDTGFSWPHALSHETNWHVCSLNYAAATNWGHAMPLQNRATSVLEYLLASRVFANKDIALIGHSFGGLVAKQMVRMAADNRNRYGDILAQLSGIVFVATPHSGSALASLGIFLRRELGATVALEDLRQANPLLRDLNDWFRRHQASSGPACHVLYETRPLRHGVLGLRTVKPVDPASADPGLVDCALIPVDADHGEVARPTSATASQYLSTLNFLQKTFAVPARDARLERQAAAICYRITNDGIEILLVRCTLNTHWCLPKGHLERDKSMSETAAEEALEEAGVRGIVDPEPFTWYVYRRVTPPGREQRAQDLRVAAFLLLVTNDKAAQPEHDRTPTWFSPEDAKARLADKRQLRFQQEFERVIDLAVQTIVQRSRKS